jgi:putative addiction module CopG family antidote
MEVILTPDQKAFIREAIENGRLQHEEEAVREALPLWEERERKRANFLASSKTPKLRVHVAKDGTSQSTPCRNSLKK